MSKGQSNIAFVNDEGKGYVFSFIPLFDLNLNFSSEMSVD